MGCPDINQHLLTGRQRRGWIERLSWLAIFLCLFSTPAFAAPLTFTVSVSEPITVTGTPRIAINVGGLTRYASYTAGSGSNTLSFAYTVQQGDFDADGVTVTPNIDLNGGSITDLAGNSLSSLSFSAASTANIKVQTYQALFDEAITSANANAVSFTLNKLPIFPANSYSYSYTITGASGGSVSAGPIGLSGSSIQVTGIDLSAFPAGEVTLTVTVAGPSGTGKPVTVKTTPTFTGVLDSLPAATTAYSTRRLRSAYSGPLLQVRRSSDNGLSDISGNTIGGGLDTAALTGFCGAASCFVTTWYDQSGNNRHVSQATAANQPRIVNAGTVEIANSRPSIFFLPSTLMTTSAAATWLNGTAYGINTVAKLSSPAGFRLMVTTGTCCSNGTLQFGWKNGGTYLFGHYGNDAEFFLTPPNLNLQVYSGDKANGAGSAAWINGVSIGTSGSPTSNLSTFAPLRLGGGIINVYDVSWNGWISEVMTFGAELSTSRTSLESNQKAWYGTP